MTESKSVALPLGDIPISVQKLQAPPKARLEKRMGWMKGFEPSASRATIWRANQLRHIHHIRFPALHRMALPHFRAGTPEGTRTPDLLLRRQLLYPTELLAHMERVMGIEPTRPAWKAGVLPLNYTRVTPLGRADAISYTIIAQIIWSVKDFLAFPPLSLLPFFGFFCMMMNRCPEKE